MNRIKEVREQKGLSQTTVAKDLKVNLRSFQRWESGEINMRQKNAQALADYFGVSVAYLLGYVIPKVELVQKVLELKQYRHLLIGGDVYIAESDVIQLIEQLFEEVEESQRTP